MQLPGFPFRPSFGLSGTPRIWVPHPWHSLSCQGGDHPYRLLAPLLAFFTFCLFSPRAPVLGPFGAAFFRAARLIFFRSSLSSIVLVLAIHFLWRDDARTV